MASAADRELLRLAPAGTRFLAGVQVDQGKVTPFGRFLLSRMKTDDKDFQTFVSATGFDPTAMWTRSWSPHPEPARDTKMG
jgi:hypothetical protein